jgi:hypothetical protein
MGESQPILRIAARKCNCHVKNRSEGTGAHSAQRDRPISVAPSFASPWLGLKHSPLWMPSLSPQ